MNLHFSFFESISSNFSFRKINSNNYLLGTFYNYERFLKNEKPAISSRLNGQTLAKYQPKLSFDAMTIVGNLNKNNAQKLSEFISVEPQIRLWDMLQTKFKAKALQEKVYIEYDKVKVDSWNRRNMRVEFNPNKLTHEEILWLKQNIIDYMEDDLSDYCAITDKSVKKMVDYWNDCFNDLHILQPDWKTIERTSDRAMVFMLLNNEEWGKLERCTKNKFKNLIKEISPFDLTDLIKLTLKENEVELQKQITFWHTNYNL